MSKKRELLENKYLKLTTLEKLVVQIISILYEPCSKATIARCLQEYQALYANNGALASTAIGVILTKLQTLKLITSRNQCDPYFVEIASRCALQEGNFKPIADIVVKILPLENGPKSLYSDVRCLRNIRIALYNADLAALTRYLELGNGQFPAFFSRTDPLIEICNNPFDKNWFQKLPLELQTHALKNIVDRSIVCLDASSEPLELLEEYQRPEYEEDISLACRETLTNRLLFSPDIAKAKALVEQSEHSSFSLSKQGWLHFIFGDYSASYDYFQIAVQALKKSSKKKKVTLDQFSSIFYIMAALKTNQEENIDAILDYIKLVEKNNEILNPTFELLKAAVLIRQNKVNEANELIQSAETKATDAISMLFLALVLFWLEPELAKYKISKLINLFAIAEKNGYTWIAYECAELLARLDDSETQQTYKTFAEKIQAELGFHSIISLIQQEQPWQRSLNALINLSEHPPEATELSRLAWVLDPENKDLYAIEQKLTPKGTWSKGRNIALSRLFDHDPTLDFLTDQDQLICTTIKKQTDYTTNTTKYQFDFNRSLGTLAGHQHIFLPTQNDLVPIELVKDEPELIIEQINKHLVIRLYPFIEQESCCLCKETPTRYKLVQPKRIHHEIANILGSQGLKIPLDTKDLVTNFINKISAEIRVQSDIGNVSKDIPKVEADPRIYVHLLPFGQGLKIELFVKPFTKTAPYFKPAAGGKTLIARINHIRQQTRRNFSLEQQNLTNLLGRCAVLAPLTDPEQSLVLEDPEVCLDLLLELQALGNEIVCEWPEGQKFKLKRTVSSSNLTLNIQQHGEQTDWFTIQGDVEISPEKKIALKDFLTFLDHSHGRFVPIGEGEFVTLTKELMRRLKELKSFADDEHPEEILVHRLSSHALDEFVNSVGSVKKSDNWQQQINRLATETTPASPPADLKAELRSYQQAGFAWMDQLARWGMGACLADDMGLGKTLQSITVLLNRGSLGPTLIVAPTSVCSNWDSEIQRFAPALTVHTLLNKNRAELVAELKPYDVLICSYGLLQQEVELLRNVRFANVVLDEAQAIKNYSTKRAQAAMALTADFKLITTGTPIENHLGELWSLFYFINPGLLGSFDSFQQKFIQPIEKKDVAKHQTLKKLIRPYILRRTKTQVLDELPPRTEITLHVEMTDEEAACYHKLRQEALDQLIVKDQETSNHIQILSEITKLRRYCCNPKLAGNQYAELPSSKLALFEEVVDELLSNDHKALVFSQFVSHLELIRELLDAKGISYQYLDGSTPIQTRKKRIDQFQAGDGDLFLISLKAGGAGLNLTAADYVIHMDPWWNPAVEDQASDRAHRIGQKRPVTIYRLIVKDTIEEKIMLLHNKKRDLANNLLSGAELSAKMSAHDLLALIKDQG